MIDRRDNRDPVKMGEVLAALRKAHPHMPLSMIVERYSAELRRVPNLQSSPGVSTR